MSAILLDIPPGGSSAAFMVDAPSVSFPLSAENNYARVYAQRFMAPSGYDGTGVMGSAGPFANTYLVAEGARTPVGGGFNSFTRTYAEVPAPHNDYQGEVLTLPIMANNRTWTDTNYRVVRIYNDFFNTTTPQSITLSGAQRFLGADGYFPGTLSAATDPTLLSYSGWKNAGTEMVASDATLTRYMGNIWRRQTAYVTAK